MELYLGVKQIKACPMTREQYNIYRNWTMPVDENPDDEGYLIEYVDSKDSNHPNHENYISWSPKEVFDVAYRRISNLTFGLAIEAIKKGEKVAREGWNGKNMFIYLVEGRGQTKAELLPGALENHVSPITEGEIIQINSHIDMKAADGTVVVGWLASQTDMLAEDWIIVE